MRIRTNSFEIEVNRASLSIYARAGRAETFVSLDDPRDNSLCWRGRTVWPAERGDETTLPPLTAEQGELAVTEEVAKRAERDRKWWRRALRGH